MLQLQHPDPSHTLLHISDTHLIGGADNLYGSSASPEANLKTLFTKVINSGVKPDAIIFTGDIADQGEAAAYQAVRAIVEPAAQELETEIVWVMGNHDVREIMRQELMHVTPTSEPLDYVQDINGLRLIVVDSSVPGHHHGQVSDDQLVWLKEVLATPSEKGSILALHHPPTPSVLKLASTVELQNQKELAAVVKDSDIRTILGGHLHYSSFTSFAGIPVSVASSTCYTQDLNVELGGTRGCDGGQSFNLIHVYDEVVMHSVVPLADAVTTVGEFVPAKKVQTILQSQGLWA